MAGLINRYLVEMGIWDNERYDMIYYNAILNEYDVIESIKIGWDYII